MVEFDELLDLSKHVATCAGRRLLDGSSHGDKSYAHCADNVREIKALADRVLEREILDALVPTGFSILSEECGYLSGQQTSNRWFIVDPLDGTFNYVKGLGPSAVSIALWEDQTPLFGVIYDLVERQLVWGGARLGAHAGDRRISVSDTSEPARASICTGFPARFDFANDRAFEHFRTTVSRYGKVRMLGSAAVSLVNVARGSADAYTEQNIMLWDVAAGIAIIQGAGGRVHWEAGTTRYSLNVYASNGILSAADWAQP